MAAYKTILMPKAVLLFLLLNIGAIPLFAQVPPDATDTFFLAKKKGWLGKLAQSISTNGAGDTAITATTSNPYLLYTGRVIRKTKIVRLGFERDINDTTKVARNFGVIVANAFHKKTTAKVIANNLFFNAGDRLNPYLLADNERFLRDQAYIQDALIIVQRVRNSPEMVDVTVIIKDVFSLGGAIDIGSIKKFRLEAKEENLKGTGSRLLLTTLYDNERRPMMGFGAEYLRRNIGGSFINATIGFKSFNNSFSSGQSEETTFYLGLERPVISPYMSVVGGLDLSINKSKNNYFTDSVYKINYKYRYHRVDGWLGYIFGSKNFIKNSVPGRTKLFMAARGIYQHFNELPAKALDSFDYRFGNITGVLGAVSVFRQNFTRTNFIYGFGRNEDLPEGFNIGVIVGFINKKDSLRDDFRGRPYFAVEGQHTHLNGKGAFTSYIIKTGGYRYKGNWEDVDLLVNIDHFTRRKKINSQWFSRQFYSLGVTRQVKTALSQPLLLNSPFGLPYFTNPGIASDLRATLKGEAVFYHLRKFWGFRIAPFLFTDLCLLKPVNATLNKSDLYSAVGGGIRTRNESLVFGTIELKGFYFPRVVGGMDRFSVSLNTNIRFRYNNVLIRRPDFILGN